MKSFPISKCSSFQIMSKAFYRKSVKPVHSFMNLDIISWLHYTIQ